MDQVAIVGAGSGNDVASALRNQAGHVDAVEIDPVIRNLGIENHPEHPYQDPRVHSIINDARNFFRTTQGSYDAIVYGVLDSHTVVSHGANMRVDSFVYTREGLQDAFDHLKPGGLLSVSFALQTPLMGEKIFHILKALPGAGAPVEILTGYDSNNTTTFMVSKAAQVRLPHAYMSGHGLTDVTKSYSATSAKALDLPSDDWPFFYLEKKMYPRTYLILLALVLGTAFSLVRGLLPARPFEPSALCFFFLGGGFMLVETKAITELGLVFGNTWQVVGVTIQGVLVMACLPICRGTPDPPEFELGLYRPVYRAAGRLWDGGPWQRACDLVAAENSPGRHAGRPTVFLGPGLFHPSQRQPQYLGRHGLQSDGRDAGRRTGI